MSRLIAVLLAVFSFSGLSAQGLSGFVEQGTTFREGFSPDYVIRVSATKMYDAEFGVFAWAITSPTWNEGVVGGVWSPRPGLQLSLGAGYEQDENPYRALASVWADLGGVSHVNLLAIGEHGGSGSWYRVLATFRVSDAVRVGVNAQRFLGVGQYVSVDVRGTPLQVWAVPFAINPENEGTFGSALGVRLKL